MIKVSNFELNDNVIKSINELLEKDISPKVAFDLFKITTTLSQIVETKNNIYNKILLKYGERDPNNPVNFKIEQKFAEDFQKDVFELDNITHEFDIDKIKVDELKLEDKIKVKDLYNLKFIFDIDLPEVKSVGGESFKENYSIEDISSSEESEEELSGEK